METAGTYVETCSCEFFCPCNFNLANGADYDRCKVTLVFNITDGEVDEPTFAGSPSSSSRTRRK